MNRRSAAQAAALLVVAILLLTLWPLPEQSYRATLSPVTCLVCGDQGAQDVIQNIIMLLPLGLALGLAGVRPAMAALGAFGLSVLVESLQYTVITGRDASLSDVVTNTMGAALGAMLAPHLPTLLRPGRHAASRLGVAVAVLWAGAWLFGAWALEGNVGQGSWRGRFPGDLPDAPSLNGTAVQAQVSGAALGLVPVSLPPEVEQRFARDSFDLRVVIRPGPPIAWRENVVTIIDVATDRGDGNNNLVMMLNRVGVRGLLSYRINAARVRLRTPSFSFGPAFDVTAGRDAALDITRTRGMLRGTADRDGQVFETEYRIGPELLWAVMAPRTPHPGVLWQIEPFLWAAALLWLAGYWAGRGRSASVLWLVVSVVLLVQAITPGIFSVARQSALGWVMLLGALAAGTVLGRRNPPALDRA